MQQMCVPVATISENDASLFTIIWAGWNVGSGWWQHNVWELVCLVIGTKHVAIWILVWKFLGASKIYQIWTLTEDWRSCAEWVAAGKSRCTTWKGQMSDGKCGDCCQITCFLHSSKQFEHHVLSTFIHSQQFESSASQLIQTNRC